MTNEDSQKIADAISTRMRSIAEAHDENLQFEYDVLKLALSALTAQPVKLPEPLLPATHKSGEAFMAADSQGNYLNREFTIKAIRTAGYEVQE